MNVKLEKGTIFTVTHNRMAPMDRSYQGDLFIAEAVDEPFIAAARLSVGGKILYTMSFDVRRYDFKIPSKGYVISILGSYPYLVL